jgi:hypothetical protein
MKNCCFLLFCFFLSTTIQAQKVEFFSDLNFGIPSNSSLKDFHNELANQVLYENFKTTDNFKYNYGFTSGMRFNKKISVFFSNKVSGAKSSVADYSGYIRLTNELKGYTFGAKYEIILKQLTKGNLFLGFKGLVTSSRLSLKTESKVLNTTENSGIDFKSLDFGTGIGMAYEYPLKFMVLRAYLDLDIYLGGKLKLKENNPNDGYLMTKNGEKVTTGWTGFNTGIGIAIPIIK